MYIHNKFIFRYLKVCLHKTKVKNVVTLVFYNSNLKDVLLWILLKIIFWTDFQIWRAVYY